MYALWLAGPMESRKLAELTGMSRAAISNLTGPMVEAGLLSREPHEKDRRRVIVGLTDLGAQEIAVVFAQHHRREIEWVSSLDPDEQQTLIRLLNKLVAGRDDFDITYRR
jgi:DNA-binding MarR family transcriptional regulator